MNKLMKGIAAGIAAVTLGFGGLTAANAATNDQIATYLTDAVATQLGLTSTDTLHQLIVDAMANNLIDPAVTDAASAAVDGTSTMTPEEMALLLDGNLPQQLGTIEQTLIDLGVMPDPNAPVVEPPVVEPPVVTTDDDDDAYEDDSDEGVIEDESDDDSASIDSDDDSDDDDSDDDESDDVDDDSDEDDDED